MMREEPSHRPQRAIFSRLGHEDRLLRGSQSRVGSVGRSEEVIRLGWQKTLDSWNFPYLVAVIAWGTTSETSAAVGRGFQPMGSDFLRHDSTCNVRPGIFGTII